MVLSLILGSVALLLIIVNFCFLFFKKSKTETGNFPSKTFQVTKIVDGDTVDVLIDNKIERIRLIGIDAPETVDPDSPVECYGPEATNKLKQLLSNQKVYLENDLSQSDRDKYNRLLRYVFLDKTNINEEMIKYGFAREYTYLKNDYKYKKEFVEAQMWSKIHHFGLWSACSHKN